MKIDSMQLIQDAVMALHEGGVLPATVAITPSTVLLGDGTPLDSLGFVSVMTEVEERVSAAAGRDVPLLFDDIHRFNPDKSSLTAQTLSLYIDQLLRRSP